MKDNAADQMDIKMALAKGALGSLPDGGKGGGQKIVERTAVLELFAKLIGARPQGLIAQFLGLGFEGVDLLDLAAVFGDLAVVGRTEDFCRDRAQSEHGVFLTGRPIRHRLRASSKEDRSTGQSAETHLERRRASGDVLSSGRWRYFSNQCVLV